MFDVIGDEITFDGHKVGKLEDVWPTLRERVEVHLREMKMEDEIEEEKVAEYDRGIRDASRESANRIAALEDDIRAFEDRIAELEQ